TSGVFEHPFARFLVFLADSADHDLCPHPTLYPSLKQGVALNQNSDPVPTSRPWLSSFLPYAKPFRNCFLPSFNFALASSRAVCSLSISVVICLLPLTHSLAGVISVVKG